MTLTLKCAVLCALLLLPCSGRLLASKDVQAPKQEPSVREDSQPRQKETVNCQEMLSRANAAEKAEALALAREVIRACPEDAFTTHFAAQILARFEQWAEAAKAYKDHVKLKPESGAELLYPAAKACAAAGRPDEAIAFYEKIVTGTSSDSYKLESARGIVRIHLAARRYDKVVEVLIQAERAIRDPVVASQVIYTVDVPDAEKRPLSAALEAALEGRNELALTHLLLANLYVDMRQTEKAKSVLTKALPMTAGDPRVLQLVGEACRGDDSLRQMGLDILESVVAAHPADMAAAVRLARAYRADGRQSDAVETCRRIVERWPNDWFAMCAAGEILRHYEQWDEAIDAYAKAIKASPTAWDATGYELACTYKKVGRPEEAVATLRYILRYTSNAVVRGLAERDLVELGARSSPLPGDLGKSLLELVRTESSLKGERWGAIPFGFWEEVPEENKEAVAGAFAAALEVAPTSLYCRVLLAEWYADSGRIAEAACVVRDTIPNIPKEDAQALYRFGMICGKHEALRPLQVEVYDRFTALEPENYQPALYLARAHVRAGDVVAGYAEARRIVEKWRDNAWALFYAGTVFDQIGSRDDADAVYTRAIAVGEADAEFREEQLPGLKRSCLQCLARNCEKRGDTARAVSYLRQALAVAENEQGRQYYQREIDRLTAKSR